MTGPVQPLGVLDGAAAWDLLLGIRTDGDARSAGLVRTPDGRWGWDRAATPEAAWLLSFAGDDTARDISRPLPERLAPLPISLLADFAGAVADLHRAGLHTFGDLLALPPAALARRCGAGFSRGLRQLLGEAEDRPAAQANYQPPAEFRDEHWFGYGVHSNTELLPAMQPLLIIRSERGQMSAWVGDAHRRR